MRSGEDVFTFATHVKRVDIPLNYFHDLFLQPHIFLLCVHLEEMITECFTWGILCDWE